MSFGFGSGGFGGSTSPFGAPSQPAMGQSAGGFGASPSPFGGGQSSVFGQQSQPAFGAGASATPAFGGGGFGAATGSGFGASSSTSGFGGGGFNAPKPAGFGFGQSSAGGFGAPASTSGFGSSGSAFGGGGQSPFGGGSAFGQPQQAAGTSFGSGGFGQPQQSSFGGTGGGFGTQAPGAFGGFGGSQSGFGAQGIQSRGTRSVAWKKTQEIDQSSTGARSTVQYNSISVMPEYASKSVEELRWEDYQDGNKGGTQQGSPGGTFGQQQPTPGGPFGQQPAQGGSSPFGQSLQSPGFGGATATSSFGGFGSTAPASSSAFGAPASSSSFGGFGGSPAAAAPSFGGFGASSTPAFGAAPTPGFGSTLGSSTAFGASSAGGFGASSTPAFGVSAPTPSFGGFGASSAPAFGASSTPAFGSSSPLSTPSFGAPQSTPSLFGSTPASTPSFGAASQSSFSLFGGSTPKPSTGFSFAAASTPSFGFGQTQAGGMFGSSPSPGFGTGGGSGLFAASTPAVQPSPFTLNPVSSPAASTPFGSAQIVSGIGAGAVQAGLQSGSPYGNMPEAPKLTPLPEYKMGLTQRILAPPSAGPPKAVTLITPRSLTPHGGKLRPRRGTTASRLSKSPAEFFASSSLQASTPGSVTSASVISEGNIFVPRDNPRRLLIRDELPSTSSASKLSLVGLSAEKASPDRTPRLEINGRTSSPASLTFRTLSPAQVGDHKNGVADAGSWMPKLTMEDYYFEPSATQLAAIAREDPEELGKICNFIVGRKDVGFIRWMEPVDIRDINLDDIVNLAAGSVEVYPESSNKPPVGEGLNKPATITLLKIFKTDEDTRKPTKDPEKIERFVRKIKKKSGEQGAQFISYDAETGIWKFSVEHFSKYGLLDSSDEEETLKNNIDQQKEVHKVGDDARVHTLPLDSSESEDEILGLRGRSAVKEKVEISVEMSEEPPTFLDRMENMEEISLGYEEAPYNVRNDHFGKPLFILDNSEQIDDIMEGMSMQEEQLPRKTYWEASQERRGIRPPASHRVVEEAIYTLGSSKVPTSSRVLPDIGSFLHNSVRVTWGPYNSLLIPQVTDKGGYKVDYCKIRPANNHLDASKVESDRDFLISQLKLHFEYSFPNENNGSMDLNPKWRLHCSRSTNKLRELTIKYIKTCHDYLKQATSHQSDERNGSVKIEAEAWDLVSALFTNVPAEETIESIEEEILADSMARMASMQRRASLSCWLKDRTFSAVKRKLEELPSDKEYDMDRILTCLSGHELSSAALCASSMGNVRLATLISAAGYTPLGMEHVQKQQDIWEKAGYDPFIDEQLMEVYNLLSGNVDAVVGIADNDWKRAFGLYLWYGTPKDSPIHTALESFVSAANKGQAPKPIPWHVKKVSEGDNISDVCFELIRIFCCTEDWDLLSEKMEATLSILPDLLCPLGTTPDILDCSFLWHLCSVLQSIDIFPQSLSGEYSDAVQRITTSYIAQIESMENLVHWAVYVALHIADDDLRAKTVKDLLARYCDEWREDEALVGFLLGDLGIPQVWLEEAKIIWAESHGDNEMLLEALIDSQQWQKAHDLLLSSIGPHWLLGKPTQFQDDKLRFVLLNALQDLESHQDEILAESWRIGGQLYLLYLNIKLGLIANGPDSAEILQEIAASLDRAFLSLTGKDSEQAAFQRAAYANIAQDILEWSKSFGLDMPGKRALRYSAVSSYIQTAAASLGPSI